MILMAPLVGSRKVAMAAAKSVERELVGHDLAEAHATIGHVRHDTSHLAGRCATAGQLELVEDEVADVDLDVLGGDAHGGDAAALAQRGQRPAQRGRHAGGLDDLVHAEAAGHLAQRRSGVALGRIDDLEAHVQGLLATRRQRLDDDDAAGATDAWPRHRPAGRWRRRP